MGDVQVAYKVIIPIIGFYGCANSTAQPRS